MKKTFEKSDILFMKAFLEQKEPRFIRKLSLDMELDYLAGICTRFIGRENYLEHKVDDLDSDVKSAISDYLNKHGNEDDNIYYLKMKTALWTLKKYYNEDGTLKALNKE